MNKPIPYATRLEILEINLNAASYQRKKAENAFEDATNDLIANRIDVQLAILELEKLKAEKPTHDA